ncbi:Dps family protein [Emcibacter nanhaiensis]|uniref:DNA starvation/stationary phase protection protein n=1 Tax=Emcibacter nanhaiensis TaxID=1505037 RepID=A0A501PHH3_9PROT|nr:Dps family protein [Emcibacter nanhaiensis]TPD59394.1 DNA starvation/stationary phase protection protein [Emcibacter nanhaiensis]
MQINIGMDNDTRQQIAEGLSRLMADTYTLYLKTHNYHWNVTGPMFQTLHEQFEVHYTELWAAIDVIAERIRSLGEYAPGTYKEFAALTSIPEDDGIPSAEQMIRNLVEANEAVTRTARSIVPLAADAGDEPTVGILGDRMEVSEKNAWMLRSLLN